MSCNKNFPESHIINPLLTSLFGQDGWILASFFFVSLWTSNPSWSINMQKKKELGQYPAILTSHLVKNPYICCEAGDSGAVNTTMLVRGGFTYYGVLDQDVIRILRGTMFWSK